ncbi:MAG: hypothetical protein RL215_2637 [Planctomycetota bacterium]
MCLAPKRSRFLDDALASSPKTIIRNDTEKSAVSGAEVPRIGAIQFSWYCHSFPLFALLTAGDKATDTGQKPGP